MKEKQLLRNYRFRDYLKTLDIKRKDFKGLPPKLKSNILIGFSSTLTN